MEAVFPQPRNIYANEAALVSTFGKSNLGWASIGICSRMAKRLAVNQKQLQHIWDTYVYELKDQYAMNP